MPPHRAGAAAGGDTSAFFAATLVLWAVWVGFEIGVRGRRELAAVAAGFAFFQAANTAVRAAVSRDPLFVNTAVSLLHSSLTSVSVIFILVNQWRHKGFENMFEHDELFGGRWVGAYSALCFSSGYFAYDQLDMLRYRLYSGWIPGILMHHLILLICFTLALYRNVTINYLILTLVCELHSIFLHIRKLRRMAGFRDFKRTMVKMEWVLNWITFVTARVICHILITYKLITDAHKFGLGLAILRLNIGGVIFLDCAPSKFQQDYNCAPVKAERYAQVDCKVSALNSITGKGSVACMFYALPSRRYYYDLLGKHTGRRNL